MSSFFLGNKREPFLLYACTGIIVCKQLILNGLNMNLYGDSSLRSESHNFSRTLLINNAKFLAETVYWPEYDLLKDI